MQQWLDYNQDKTMVQAESSLLFKATLDSDEFDQGMRRLRLDLRIMQVETDKAGTSFQQLKGFASGVASNLAKVGAAGGAALTALATQSPAVASEMAAIKNEMRELSFTAGETLKPLFSAVADDLLPALNNRLETSSQKTDTFISNWSSGLSKVSGLLNQNIQTESDGAATLGALLFGAIGGTVGGLLGGAGGAAAGAAFAAPLGAESFTTPTPNAGQQIQQSNNALNTPILPAFGDFLEKLFGLKVERDMLLFDNSSIGGGGSI